MPKELFNELPLRRRVDRAIEVMSGMAPPTKAPYQMNHEELKELNAQLEELLAKGYIKPSKEVGTSLLVAFFNTLWRKIQTTRKEE
jgi:hypothetical protein